MSIYRFSVTKEEKRLRSTEVLVNPILSQWPLSGKAARQNSIRNAGQLHNTLSSHLLNL